LEDRRLLSAAGLANWAPPPSVDAHEPDHTLFVDYFEGHNMDLVVEPLPDGAQHGESSTAVGAALAMSSAVYPLNSIPPLHSNPGDPAAAQQPRSAGDVVFGFQRALTIDLGILSQSTNARVRCRRRRNNL
jgi:hypothetical protein